MRLATKLFLPVPLLVLPLTGCGGDDGASSPPADEVTSSSSEAPATSPTPAEVDTVTADIRGDAGIFETGGGAAGFTVDINGRECVLEEQLPLSCRASTGVGGGFVVTGGIDALNGEESPVLFLDGTGARACAVADGKGGIRVGSPQGEVCA